MDEIKEVKAGDLTLLAKEADLVKAFLPSRSEPDSSIEKFLLKTDSLGTIFFGTFRANKIIGFVSLMPKNEGVFSIGPMYVAKDFQGQHIGKQQVLEIIDWAKKQRLKGLFTKTWGENIPSRNIFEGLGFKATEEKPNARVNGDSTIKYFLEL